MGRRWTLITTRFLTFSPTYCSVVQDERKHASDQCGLRVYTGRESAVTIIDGSNLSQTNAKKSPYWMLFIAQIQSKENVTMKIMQVDRPELEAVSFLYSFCVTFVEKIFVA